MGSGNLINMFEKDCSVAWYLQGILNVPVPQAVDEEIQEKANN